MDTNEHQFTEERRYSSIVIELVALFVAWAATVGKAHGDSSPFVLIRG
jgi:hypothetical protein